MKKHLDNKEYEVLRLSYGLDCNKHSAKEIASLLDIKGTRYCHGFRDKKEGCTNLDRQCRSHTST